MASARLYCTLCGRHRDEVGKISARGKCGGCGEAAMRANAEQLAGHRGPYFTHWRQRAAAAYGVSLPDER